MNCQLLFRKFYFFFKIELIISNNYYVGNLLTIRLRNKPKKRHQKTPKNPQNASKHQELIFVTKIFRNFEKLDFFFHFINDPSIHSFVTKLLPLLLSSILLEILDYFNHSHSSMSHERKFIKIPLKKVLTNADVQTEC